MATYRANETATSSKAESYRKFVRTKIQDSEFAGLYAGLENVEAQKNVVGHVADVLYRIKRNFGEPCNVTFDDVLLLSIAIERMKLKKERGEFKSIFSYLPVVPAQVAGVASRIVEYEIGLLGQTNFKNDDPEEIRKILLFELIRGKQTIITINDKSYVPRDTQCTRRLDGIHKVDKVSLAMLTWRAQIEETLNAGSRAQFAHRL